MSIIEMGRLGLAKDDVGWTPESGCLWDLVMRWQSIGMH